MPETMFGVLFRPYPGKGCPELRMRLLIIPDKFKGTLDAARAAQAIAAGWRAARPQDSLRILPMSDGGDGFGSVLGGLLEAGPRRVRTTDAAGLPRTARWWWSPSRHIAILETAQSNGLALLARGTHHPFDLDTTGVARLVRAAVDAGARTCLLGVGGSATNDGGFGLARALGWRFLDRTGDALQRWTQLDRLARIEKPPVSPALSRCRFVVATDVSNPLLGRLGASRVYGPQKGLRPEDFPVADACLGRLAQVVKRDFGFDSRNPGCGAAGGLGFGLQAFLGARRELGFDVFARLARLERLVRAADLVITGEGSADASTLMGKGVGQVLEVCRRLGRPAMILAGRVDLGGRMPAGIVGIHSLVGHVGESTALKKTAPSLRSLAREVAAAFQPSPKVRPTHRR